MHFLTRSIPDLEGLMSPVKGGEKWLCNGSAQSMKLLYSGLS